MYRLLSAARGVTVSSATVRYDGSAVELFPRVVGARAVVRSTAGTGAPGGRAGRAPAGGIAGSRGFETKHGGISNFD